LKRSCWAWAHALSVCETSREKVIKIWREGLAKNI
jgi:hypothetical protein